jgi:hypothetical protein
MTAVAVLLGVFVLFMVKTRWARGSGAVVCVLFGLVLASSPAGHRRVHAGLHDVACHGDGGSRRAGCHRDRNSGAVASPAAGLLPPIVVSRWRAALVYRRRWQPAMVTCGLAVQAEDREYLPKIRRVIADEFTDRLLVDLMSG